MLQGAVCLAKSGNSPGIVRIIGVVALVSGFLLILGLRTRFVGFVIGLEIAALWRLPLSLPIENLFHPSLTALLAETISTATVLLGPGAFSLDARLFGRREITIPPRSS